MSKSTTAVERSAARVAGRLKSDWQNAYEIACCVGLGNGQGRREPLLESSPEVKVSAVEFARLIEEAAGGKVYGFGRKAVSATLKKWDDLATDPKWDLPPSSDLTPEMADKVDDVIFPDRPWREETGSEYTVRTKDHDIKNNAPAVAKALEDPEFAKKVTAKTKPETTAKIAAEAIKTEAGRKAVAKEMVESKQVENLRAATSEAAVTEFLESEAGKKYERGQKERAAQEQSTKEEIATTGALGMPAMLRILPSLYAGDEFVALAESVGYRIADEETRDVLREYADRLEAMAQFIRDICDGKTPTKLSDEDLVALLEG